MILSVLLMHASIFVIAPLIVVRLIERLNEDQHQFTHEEQERILATLARLEERLERLESVEPAMHRLFVACPSRGVADLLLDLMDGPERLRWVHADSLHLTLRFIGEVDGATAEDVAAALGACASPPFTWRWRGVGAFSHRRHGALWAGVAPREPLAALAAKVERAVQTAGLPPETRAYHPHITLARWSGASPALEGWLRHHASLASPSWNADRLALFESRLGKAGPHYDEVVSVRLG
jgi:2'-5' RNA ligase